MKVRALLAVVIVLWWGNVAAAACDKGFSIETSLRRQLAVLPDLAGVDEDLTWDWGEPKAEKQKSAPLAMALSFVVPGAGELYAGAKTRAFIFFSMEGGIWGGYYGFKSYSRWRESDYENFAAVHAGVINAGKDDTFYEKMTYYESRDYYNQITRVYDRNEENTYPEDEFWNWEWDREESRERFRELRNQSKSANRRAVFMLGAAVVNRIVSAIDAYVAIRSFNQAQEFATVKNWRLRCDADLLGSDKSIRLTLRKEFY
jgi:TM2 domain-containing membrane protein YozV